MEDKPAVPAGKSRRDADAKALKADAGRKREPHEEDAMPWSAGTAGNQKKFHRVPLVDRSNAAGTAGNQVSLNLPPPCDAAGKEAGETNGEEKAETPVPTPDAENPTRSGQGKEPTRPGHGDQGEGGWNSGEDGRPSRNWQ